MLWDVRGCLSMHGADSAWPEQLQRLLGGMPQRGSRASLGAGCRQALEPRGHSVVMPSLGCDLGRRWLQGHRPEGSSWKEVDGQDGGAASGNGTPGQGLREPCASLGLPSRLVALKEEVSPEYSACLLASLLPQESTKGVTSKAKPGEGLTSERYPVGDAATASCEAL